MRHKNNIIFRIPNLDFSVPILNTLIWQKRLGKIILIEQGTEQPTGEVGKFLVKLSAFLFCSVVG